MAAKKFAVIGHPVAHSLSPKMHAANFAANGYEGTYEKFDVEPADVEKFVLGLRDAGYAGINVTVPHKLAVIPLLDEADAGVEKYGACNTIRFAEDGRLWGYNTDVIGFADCLAEHGATLAGRRVFLVGCGGAGGALAAVCADEGADLTLADLDGARVEALAAKLAGRGAGKVDFVPPAPESAPGAGICGSDPAASRALWGERAKGAEIIVNATPMGLHEGDPSALPESSFSPGQFVLDIVPTVKFPPTAAAARAAGAEAADGLEFLVGQGAKSFEIWTGLKADRRAMLAAIRG